MTEEQIKMSLNENDSNTAQRVCEALRDYGSNARQHLADFVASLCNIDKERMQSKCNDLDVAQCRWMFWFAYRFMTNETYDKIGRISEQLYGKRYTKVGVSIGVSKMSSLIEQNSMWKKRWTIIKRVIKESNETLVEPPTPITITIPKNVELTIKKE